MKLWVDDLRPAPDGYVWCKSVNEARGQILHSIGQISHCYRNNYAIDNDLFIDEINLDYDAGEYANDGGDYIELLNWLEWLGGDVENWEFHIHSRNPVGVENMRRIIRRNGWKEVIELMQKVEN